MFEHERKIYGFNLAFMERLLADVAEEELAHQPVASMNTPRWIMGHLAISTDFSLR